MRLLLFLLPLSLLFAQTPPLIENEYVRVVKATDQPVAKPGPLHEHKQNRVMIYLDSGDMQIKYANGKVDNQHWKAGDIAWSPANGTHTSQNVSSKPLRIIEVEVRKEGSGAASRSTPKPVLENSQVRVYRSSQAPPAGTNFVAVDEKAALASWNKLPQGSGPFVIVELK